jgi:saccharopepsin
MKGAILATTVAVAVSSVSAGIHKMPLKKISLTEQLAYANVPQQARALGQKYMGIRPESHAEEMFKDTQFKGEGGHTVPVANFMNAQCKFASFIELAHCLMDI